MEKESGRIYVSFKNDLRFVEVAMLALNHLKTLLSIDEDDFFKLEISLREALNNAIVHGNRLNPESTVHLDLNWKNCNMRLSVEDESPVVPDWQKIEKELAGRQITATSGRGLLIIRNYMDSISLERGKLGNRVVMAKEFNENTGS